MIREWRAALTIFGLLTLLTGVLYPGLVTLIGQTVFPRQSNGSLIVRDGQPVGSRWLGRSFEGPRYFWSRPSATAPQPYNGRASSGSNLAATNPALVKAVAERVAALRALDPGNTAPVPVDLVTASGSGLDPHISPAAARYQAPRVARARALPEAKVIELVEKLTENRAFGVLGEPRVNVLELNLALDELTPE